MGGRGRDGEEKGNFNLLFIVFFSEIFFFFRNGSRKEILGEVEGYS